MLRIKSKDFRRGERSLRVREQLKWASEGIFMVGAARKCMLDHYKTPFHSIPSELSPIAQLASPTHCTAASWKRT
jgi:hypothetical protein